MQHLKHLQVLFRETAIVRPYQDVPLQFLKILVLRRAHCFLDFEARPLQSWMFGACESIQLETLKFYDAEMKDCTEFLESFRISETIRECTLRRWEEPAQNVRKRAAIFRDFDTGTVWEWLRKAKN